MGQYVLRRFLALIPVLLFMSVLVFTVMWVLPGDPARAMVGLEADPAAYERARDLLGLDRPLHKQYFAWLTSAIQGDLGTSYRSNRSVATLIADRVPVTLQLTMIAAVIVLLVALPVGTLAGANRNSTLDRLTTVLAASGVAIPSFWLGLLLITVFSLKLGWFPAFGYVSMTDDPVASVRSLVLPALALAMPSAAAVTRMVRSNIVEAMNQDYVRTARAKGLRERVVVVRHALRNSLIPVLTLFGLLLGQMLSGSIVIEVVFGLPGLGRLAVDSILFRELVVVQAIVLLVATVTVILNLVVDLGYALLDPRIRYSR